MIDLLSYQGIKLEHFIPPYLSFESTVYLDKKEEVQPGVYNLCNTKKIKKS